MRIVSPILLSIVLLSSCATSYGRTYGLETIERRRESRPSLVVIPSTLLVLQQQRVSKSLPAVIELSAARGEAESAQLLYVAGSEDEGGLRFVASDLTAAGAESLSVETGIVAYVPVRKPSFVGFHRRGEYPDPIMPEAEFAVRSGRSQALWYTVRVPPSALPGFYSGKVSVIDRRGEEIAIPVRLRVYDVDLPATSFLKTSINFRRENARDPRYYGTNWNSELEARLPILGLAYRFSHRVDLHLLEVFSRAEDGSLKANWTDFDAQARYWLDQGISCFELKLPIAWSQSPEEIHAQFGEMLEAINSHLLDKGWIELFYFYFYDEPFASELGEIEARYDAIKQHAPDVRNVLTYGSTKAGQRKLIGKVGIWVPNLHQFDADFARKRQEAGDEVWAYVCVQNAFRRYPDNFRIDWYGTAHRALGWWLFANGADGFLYWAVDLWRKNPWETSETFPLTNGDGVLFYPAPDGKSLPYPSIRAHLMRDAFEDYDLLTLLQQAYLGSDKMPEEVRELLEAKALIRMPRTFSKDDELYSLCHARVLEYLEAAKRDREP